MDKTDNNVKKPWYKRWKVWAGVVVAVAFINLFAPEEAAEEKGADASTAEVKPEKSAIMAEKEAAKVEEPSKASPEVVAAVDKAVAETDIKKDRASLDEKLGVIADVSEGTIINAYVNPYAPEGTANQIHAIISDSWYYSEEHEKERFADIVYDAVKAVLVTEGAIEGYDKTISVTLYDEYEKELAKSKLTGGFKIKR